jgi:hypothetical protein
MVCFPGENIPIGSDMIVADGESTASQIWMFTEKI